MNHHRGLVFLIYKQNHRILSEMTINILLNSNYYIFYLKVTVSVCQKRFLIFMLKTFAQKMPGKSNECIHILWSKRQKKKKN